MGKTIAIRGKEKCDFAYYIAKSLASNKFTVCVIDNSYIKDLYSSVQLNKEDDYSVVEKENIVYIKNAVINEEFKNKFDFIIFYQGMNDRELSSDYSFIMPDYTSISICEIKKLSPELIEDSYFIMRDRVSKKITEKDIIHELEINNEQMLGFLPLNIEDEAGYQTITYEGRTKIKKLSTDMQLAIMSVIAIVTGDDIKTVKKYYRKAKRNKRF